MIFEGTTEKANWAGLVSTSLTKLRLALSSSVKLIKREGSAVNRALNDSTYPNLKLVPASLSKKKIVTKKATTYTRDR